MAARRFNNPSPVFQDLLGTTTAPGGFWHFYQLNTTTPKQTFQDYALTIPNLNPIELDSSGRFPVPVWLDGDYTVELKAANGSSIINPTDIRPEIAPGLAIPDPLGHSGEYLTNNGTDVEWSGPVYALPDPTGSPGDMVVVNSDGTDYILQAQPEIPEPDITVATASSTIGGGGSLKQVMQWGAGTAPASGAPQTSLAVVFPTPFKSGTTPFVVPIATNAQAGGFPVAALSGNPTATGATFIFDVAEGDSDSPIFSSPQNFLWFAVGVIDG